MEEKMMTTELDPNEVAKLGDYLCKHYDRLERVDNDIFQAILICADAGHMGCNDRCIAQSFRELRNFLEFTKKLLPSPEFMKEIENE